jgi:hypothetical protein
MQTPTLLCSDVAMCGIPTGGLLLRVTATNTTTLACHAQLLATQVQVPEICSSSQPQLVLKGHSACLYASILPTADPLEYFDVSVCIREDATAHRPAEVVYLARISLSGEMKSVDESWVQGSLTTCCEQVQMHVGCVSSVVVAPDMGAIGLHRINTHATSSWCGLAPPFLGRSLV